MMISQCLAQLDKKTFLVGGNGSFFSFNEKFNSSVDTNTKKINNIDIKASIGYFPIDKLVVGLRPSFYFYKGKIYRNGIEAGEIAGYSQFLVGPFVRYYLLNKEKQFNLLVDASYLVGTNVSPLPPRLSGALKELSLSAGAEIFFNSTCGIEFLVSYKDLYEDVKDTPSYQNEKRGIQISIGFQLHLLK